MARRLGLSPLAGALALLLVAAGGAVAQQGVVVIDMAGVMREAAAAQALEAIEAEERRLLRERLDAFQRSLEAEEAELTELRGRLPSAEFDSRVRAFDLRVREGRRRAQAAAEALRERFSRAGSALRAAVQPVIAALMDERGAAVALDRSAVLRANSGVDVTAEVVERLDAVRPAESAAALVPRGEPFAPPPPSAPGAPTPPPTRPGAADRG